VGDKVALGQVSSEYFGFPCQSLFHHFLHNHHPSPIIRGWYNRPIVAAVPKVPQHKLKKIYLVSPQDNLSKIAGSIQDKTIGFFFQLIYSFQPHYGPGVDSAS
jgi:hypothetical protein